MCSRLLGCHSCGAVPLASELLIVQAVDGVATFVACEPKKSTN